MKPRPITVSGDVAFIPLSGGHTAVIDAVDLHLVEGVNWSASRSHKTTYAMRRALRDGKWVRVSLHRLLMGDPPGLQVDHKDGNGLNCRRSNLRTATSQQNAMNRGMRTNNKLGMKGVTRVGRRFRAEVQADGVKHYLGLFTTPEQAHTTYCEAGKSLHGEFWRPM